MLGFFLSIPIAYLNLYKVLFIIRVIVALRQKKNKKKDERITRKWKRICYG